MNFNRLIGLAAGLALLVGVTSTELSANTITMANYNGGGTDTVECSSQCLGFVGDISVEIMTSSTDADLYPQTGDSSPGAELAKLNELLALFDPARPAETYVNKTDGAGNSFTTNRQYFSIKQSTAFYFFENTSGGTVTVDLGVDTPNYSHWTEYGSTVSPVPVPAAVWLFGTALIGFIGLSRRTKV